MVQLSTTFAALADDNRRRVLEALTEGGDATASALAGPLGITVTGLLKHVAVLEAAGLVATTKVGRSRRCGLGPARLDDAAAWLATHQQRWDGRVDRFDAHLRHLHPGAPR